MSIEQDLKEQIELLKKQLAMKDDDLAHFRESLRQAQEKMKKIFSQVSQDVNTLKKIQNILIPTELPHIPGFQFIAKIIQGQKSGSDYFDIFSKKQRFHFGFLLSTCSSYGVSALFLSVLLKWSAELKSQKVSIDKVFKVLLENLCPSLKKSDHLHLFYGHMNHKNFQFHYGLVGDILALHLKQSGAKILKSAKPLEKNSQMSSKGAAHLLKLKPKDTILLCSPGVFQVPHHETGELYPQERVFEIAKNWPRDDIHELRNQFFYDLKSFSKKEKFDQDVSLFVFRIKERTLRLAEEDDEVRK